MPEASDGRVEREVRLRHVRVRDAPWLVRFALRREFVGVQYATYEAPLQIVLAPLRALLGPFVPACVVLVDGERAGYIGRSALSGGIEYMVGQEWRGGGVGRRAITEFFGHFRAGDRPRRLYVRHGNDRSMKALLGAFDALGWSEGADYTTHSNRHHTVLSVPAG